MNQDHFCLMHIFEIFAFREINEGIEPYEEYGSFITWYSIFTRICLIFAVPNMLFMTVKREILFTYVWMITTKHKTNDWCLHKKHIFLIDWIIGLQRISNSSSTKMFSKKLDIILMYQNGNTWIVPSTGSTERQETSRDFECYRSRKFYSWSCNGKTDQNTFWTDLKSID